MIRLVNISIHALREEGDISCRMRRSVLSYFYPRPPRGGRLDGVSTRRCPTEKITSPKTRRATRTLLHPAGCDYISIHALREEGDYVPVVSTSPASLFLSTPSARRATAKTETKSLFSNKLYNILHEFRRALIYNGSKNYPNHAK